jgi:hypothetical protein
VAIYAAHDLKLGVRWNLESLPTYAPLWGAQGLIEPLIS